MDEAQRIQKAYAKRDMLGKKVAWSLFNTASLFINQQREKDILRILTLLGITNLYYKKFLDLGCGNGSCLRDFIRYGAKPENCYGIDLLANRIEEANKVSPNIHFQCGNAENLPYENDFFDIVLCYTVFSSIFDRSMRYNIVKEMLRVLRPRGVILFYDFNIKKPSNLDTRGIKKREILESFQGCKIVLKRVTLAPPITRTLAPHSILLCYILEKLKFLNTH